MKLAPELIYILDSAQIDGNVLRLTCGQLDRPTYERINKALTELGGKWDRRSKGHVFACDDLSARVEAAVLEGETISEKKVFDFFQTPPDLAARIVDLAGIRNGMRVLEPSAGLGRIALRAQAVGAKVDMVELNPACRDAMHKDGHEFAGFDFMEFESEPYDAIVANPPFSKRQDAKHILRMLTLLKPAGRLVSVASSGLTFRADRLFQELRDRIDSLGGSIEPLPDATFKSEGTNVNTCLVIVGI